MICNEKAIEIMTTTAAVNCKVFKPHDGLGVAEH